MNRPDFIAQLAPVVQQVRREGSHMFPSVRLAQNILETGCKIPAWNNLGGIKVGSGKPNAYWTGKVVNKGTWEVYNGKTVDVIAAFRAYDSLYDFYKDQDLLLNNARYARVRASRTPEEQAAMLKECGYATDPQYAGKLVSIIKAEGLKKYDVSGEDEEKLELSKYQWQVLTAGVESLLERKVITDKTWLEKAKTNKLTVSELSWLTFVVAVNQ